MQEGFFHLVLDEWITAKTWLPDYTMQQRTHAGLKAFSIVSVLVVLGVSLITPATTFAKMLL